MLYIRQHIYQYKQLNRNMTEKHLLKLDKMPTDEEFVSDTWTNRLDYVGLVKNGGGG